MRGHLSAGSVERRALPSPNTTRAPLPGPASLPSEKPAYLACDFSSIVTVLTLPVKGNGDA